MATVMHKTRQDGSTVDRIDSISALHKGLKCPDAINEPYAYNIEEHPKNWDRLPKWVQEQIEQSPEFSKVTNTQPEEVTEETDECPF